MDCPEDYDCATIYRIRWHRTRRDRTCCACAESIPTGAEYLRHASLYDGRWWDSVQCSRCAMLWLELRDIAEGDQWPLVTLDCGCWITTEKIDEECLVHVDQATYDRLAGLVMGETWDVVPQRYREHWAVSKER